MELVNKFDNALAGVAGDGGTIGQSSTSATSWRPAVLGHATCDAAGPGVHDNDQLDVSARRSTRSRTRCSAPSPSLHWRRAAGLPAAATLQHDAG